MPKVFIRVLTPDANELINETLRDLCRSIYHMLVCAHYICRLVNAMVYLGISLNAGNIGGDLYVNFTISSIVEMFGFIICIDLLQR